MHAHAERARRIIAELPEELLQASREPSTASKLVYALLLGRDDAKRSRQTAIITAATDSATADETSRMAVLIQRVGREVPDLDVGHLSELRD